MKSMATLLLMALLMPGIMLAQQAPLRTDMIPVRDIGSATLTLDGQLTEAEWAQAYTLSLKWNENAGFPGSGQKIDGSFTLAEPSDPIDATLKFLRKGNQVWIGVDVKDASIGGTRGLHAGNWNFDGILMNIADRTRAVPSETDPNFFGGGPYPEFFYSWWNPVDTLAGGIAIPGIQPRAFGRFAMDWLEGVFTPNPVRRDTTKWNYRTTVRGLANDDSQGPDQGYTMEMMMDLGQMGYDFNRPNGDRASFNIAIQDYDFGWPADSDKLFTSRVWFQNQWANNFNEGVGYLYGSPDLTLTAAVNETVLREPDVRIPSLGGLPAPTMNGRMDDPAWQAAPVAFSLQYKNSELLSQLPVHGLLQARYFRPNLGAGTAAPVIDPSTARFKMFHQGTKLYIGVEVDDQAISSNIDSENLFDGVRIAVNRRDTVTSSGTPIVDQLEAVMGADNVMALRAAALRIVGENPDAIRIAQHVRGTSGDPSDVDEGYTLEMEIDLPMALGYPADFGDRLFFVSALFFDADILEDAEASTSTRTWFLRERGVGPGLWTYLDPQLTLTSSEENVQPGQFLASVQIAPNPASGVARLHYTLAQPGFVDVAVYDLLGRQVAQLTPGQQLMGSRDLALDVNGFAPGVYVYRMTISNGLAQTQSVTGRFVVAR